MDSEKSKSEVHKIKFCILSVSKETLFNGP